MKTLSMVIVNYNSARFMAPFLDTVKSQDFRDFELIVVDNNSQDDSLALVGKVFPEATILRNSKNQGYARAANQGMALSGAPYVLMQNFDTLLSERYVGALLEGAERRPEIGSVCGKIHRMSMDLKKKNTIDSAGHTLVSRWPGNRGWEEPDNGQYDTPRIVFGAPGTSALYKRAMLDDTALRGEFYDEGFFMYCEDADLNWRANIRGWLALYTPDAVMWHATKGSLDQQRRAELTSHFDRMFQMNRALMILKNDRADQARGAVSTALGMTRKVYRFKARRWEPESLRFWKCMVPALVKRRAINLRRNVSFDDLEYWFEHDSRDAES